MTIIDRRPHIGGNAYDPICPETGQRYHMYGPHIFHTTSTTVLTFLSRFTKWIPYRHRVMAYVDGVGQVPFPININTLNILYSKSLRNEQDMRSFLKSMKEPVQDPSNAQEYLHGIYGKELTELFFSRYTLKMWDTSLEELPVSTVARLPVRYDTSADYFTDKWQLMPKYGFHALFTNMLNHPSIRIKLNTNFKKEMEGGYKHIFNSMSIDEYYHFRFGELPYRSILFAHKNVSPFKNLVPTVNFTHTDSNTRVTDWRLYPGAGGGEQRKITFETPCSYKKNNMERYYPVRTIDEGPKKIYRKYKALCDANRHVTFIGRCGQYIYYDMHQVVANSLGICKNFLTQN